MVHPKVVIVMAKCVHSKQDLGIRFEKHLANQWIGDWAFPIKAAVAQREGYDRNSVSGQFSFAPAYPGCPECRGKNIVKCFCGGVACWDAKRRTHTCPWCNARSNIEGQIQDLRAGDDR